MTSPDPIKVVELQANMIAMRHYMAMLQTNGRSQGEEERARQRAEVDTATQSLRSDAEKVAWMNKYANVFRELGAKQTDDEADAETLRLFPAERIWWYIDPETNRESPAILEALQPLVEVGFVGSGSRIKRPQSKVWLTVGECHELRDALAKWKAVIAWRVRLGGREYVADDLATLAEWVRAGRVLPDTEILNPEEQSWRKAKDEPRLKTVSFVKSGCLSVLMFWMR